MSVSFLDLWLGNVLFGAIVVAIYSLLMFARSIASRDRILDGHSDWLECVASTTVTVAIGLAFIVDANWFLEVFSK